MHTITKTLTIAKAYLVGATQEHRETSQSLNPIRLGTGLSNRIREQLAQEDRVQFSLLMDCAIRYSFEGAKVTVEDIEAMTSLKPYTISKALSDHLIRVTIKHTGKRGAPKKYYHIPTKDHVRKMTTPGEIGMSDHLPEWGLESVKRYRMARYKTLILRGCKYVASDFVTYSRTFLCAVIGVSKTTLIEYEKSLEMTVISNVQETPITADNAHQLAGDTTQKRAQGAFLKVELNGVIDNIPAIRSLAYRALGIGAQVTLFQHLPNTYSVNHWST